jgi:anti-sigma factor RsiW
MSLSDEQIEAILRGEAEVPPGLGPADKARLGETRAVQRRLRQAFASVQPDGMLVRRVSAAVNEAVAAARRRRGRLLRLPVARWALTAAAAVIGVAVVLLVPEDRTAQAELAGIHHANVGRQGDFHPMTDANQVAAHLGEALGFVPVVPVLEPAWSVTGCVLRRFRGRRAPSYVLRLPQGVVSIVITDEPPERMNLDRRFDRDGLRFHACGHGDCKLVALRIGRRTYCAVGEVTHEVLTAVLLHLPRPDGLAPAAHTDSGAADAQVITRLSQMTLGLALRHSRCS